MQNFWALGAPPLDPVPPAAGGFASEPPASGGWGLRPQTPISLRRLEAPPPDPQNSPPPLQISGYAPGRQRTVPKLYPSIIHNPPPNVKFASIN